MPELLRGDARHAVVERTRRLPAAGVERLVHVVHDRSRLRRAINRPTTPRATTLRGVSATIGVIGIGRMGLPVCARLSKAGLDVVAGDRRPECAPQARAVGARWMPATLDVVEAADVLITVLPGSGELEDAMVTAIPVLRPGATWLDMTSAEPRLGRDLMQRAERQGAACLEAPVGGGPDAAGSGTLQLFVGGPADVLERHRALLETLGTTTHVGAHGAGYLTKLLVNTLWFAQAVALGETLVLGMRDGVDPRTLVTVIQHSAAANELVHSHGEALLSGDYLATYGLDRCCDQLDAVVRLAGEQGIPCELSSTVQRAYRDALARFGPVDGELLPVARLQERSGVRLGEEPS
ncbi:MAG: NAD(P)-dependent oxidoreductase [Solirubrobacteraceae bacterium]